MYFITTKRMLEVCFSVHPNIQYRTFFYIKLTVCIDIMGKICLNYVITIKKEHCSGIRNNRAGCKIYLCECVGFS